MFYLLHSWRSRKLSVFLLFLVEHIMSSFNARYSFNEKEESFLELFCKL